MTKSIGIGTLRQHQITLTSIMDWEDFVAMQFQILPCNQFQSETVDYNHHVWDVCLLVKC